MLVFTRKVNESIEIAGHIRITVVEVAGDRVKLGVDAPRELSVHRAEVLAKPRRPPSGRSSAS